jgi:four helix bundle protein
MRLFSFEKLDVWQLSRELTVDIYKLTNLFPTEERYNLISQMRRSAVSVGSNIAEGNGRTTGADQARFTEIAYGSLMEILNQLILSFDLEYISEEEYNVVRTKIQTISYKLNNLRISQLKRK